MLVTDVTIYNKLNPEFAKSARKEDNKGLPAIINSNANDVDDYAKARRYKSFDRTNRNKSTQPNITSDNSRDALNKLERLEKLRKLQNLSVDMVEIPSSLDSKLRHSSFEPLLQLKTVVGNRLTHEVSPTSLSPHNREQWPGTIKNPNVIENDLTVSPRSILDKYEKERRNKVLSVNQLISKNKPLSMWDAMSIYDTNNFKKECIVNEINRKEKQRQLKKFYDSQVKDKHNRSNYEKQRSSHEHLDLLSE